MKFQVSGFKFKVQSIVIVIIVVIVVNYSDAVTINDA